MRKNNRKLGALQPLAAAHQSAPAATANRTMATDQAMSWRRRRDSHLSKVIRPKARDTRAEAAARGTVGDTRADLVTGEFGEGLREKAHEAIA